MDVIKDCLITQSDAKVLKEYCIDKSNPLYKEYKGFNTSVNLEATDIYNGYMGLVAMVSGDSRTGYEVTVQLNLDQAVKYGNLKHVDVQMNNYIDIGEKIGVANKWLRFEYMNTNVHNQYSFRVGDVQMYKDDPMNILDPDRFVLLSSSEQYSNSGLIDIEEEFDDGFEPLEEFDSDNGSVDD